MYQNQPEITAGEAGRGEDEVRGDADDDVVGKSSELAVGAGALDSVDNLFTDNSDTMIQLLGSLTTTSQLLYLRVPALSALFPDSGTRPWNPAPSNDTVTSLAGSTPSGTSK